MASVAEVEDLLLNISNGKYSMSRKVDHKGIPHIELKSWSHTKPSEGTIKLGEKKYSFV